MKTLTRARLLVIDPYDSYPPHFLESISPVDVVTLEEGYIGYAHNCIMMPDQNHPLDLFYQSGAHNKDKSIHSFERLAALKPRHIPDSTNLGYIILVDALPSPYVTYGWKTIEVAKKTLDLVKSMASTPNYVFAVLNGDKRDSMFLEDIQMVMDEESSSRFVLCNPSDKHSVKQVIATLLAHIGYNAEPLLCGF